MSVNFAFNINMQFGNITAVVFVEDNNEGYKYFGKVTTCRIFGKVYHSYQQLFFYRNYPFSETSGPLMMNVRNSGNSECIEPCSSGMTSLGAVPAPIRKRRFSSAKIQPTRVKRVMQSDDEIGRMVASVPVAIGRAMEHFAEKLLETAAQCVLYSTSRTLSPSHIKQAVMQTPHFKFLESLVREIPLPPSAGSEVQWKTDLADQPSFSGFYPPGYWFCSYLFVFIAFDLTFGAQFML
ncbi:hypothetical protein X798_05386 [Onchocerca flexuosa]|uniref:Transcription factor CBF/NF-Y/archaeal histone domain-containing protein n=1 Tax=Onchocerca flexuosa TaxID=387005 RepID=A0A238BQD9_9BILA|nr:hypothetical protein X798_05386 [Onchocerca flexuosa]